MSSQQTASYSPEEMEHYNQYVGSAPMQTRRDHLKRIKFEMNASNERNDMMDEDQDPNALLTFMENVGKNYNEMLRRQSTALLDRGKQLKKFSVATGVQKCIDGVQKGAIDILVDELKKCKASEEKIKCDLREFEQNEKCLEDALAKVKSELAAKNVEIKMLRAAGRNCEDERSAARRQLNECTRRCDGLTETVTALNGELKCRSNELDDERTNACRLKTTLEYEREWYGNQSKMDGKRIKDMQLQCDELTCKLDQEKQRSKKLASKVSEMCQATAATAAAAAAAAAAEREANERQGRQNACAPPPPKSPVCDAREDTLKKKIKNLLKDNETKDVRTKEPRSSKCCAAAAATAAAVASSTSPCRSRHAAKRAETCGERKSPRKCATKAQSSSCHCHATKIEKPSPRCAAKKRSSSTTSSLSSSSSSSLTTTTVCCGNAKTAASRHNKRSSTGRHHHHHPIGDYQAEVQKLLGEFDCVSRDARKMYRNM